MLHDRKFALYEGWDIPKFLAESCCSDALFEWENIDFVEED